MPYLLKLLACLDPNHLFFTKGYIYEPPKEENEAAAKVQIREGILEGLPKRPVKTKRNTICHYLVTPEEKRALAQTKLKRKIEKLTNKLRQMEGEVESARLDSRTVSPVK